MPNRIIREGILTSERVDALTNWAAECFYRRLMSVVDDFGRYYANPSLLRAACYPLKLDKVSNADIEKWLADCAGAALVSTYENNGKRYLQLQDFRQQVRANESKFPEPTADALQLHSKCVADAQHVRTKTESETYTKSKANKSRQGAKCPLPDDFSISERVQAWAKEKGYSQLAEHLDAFKRKAAMNAYRYTDWDLAFMEAVREDWAKLRNAKPGQPVVLGEVSWRTSSEGIKAKAIELGLPWQGKQHAQLADECENYERAMNISKRTGQPMENYL